MEFVACMAGMRNLLNLSLENSREERFVDLGIDGKKTLNKRWRSSV
jgi:hypothetical protein